MAFLQVQFFSKALDVASTVNVILPEANQGIGLTAAAADTLPKVLYLLHGYSDDQSIWMRRTSVERYAAEHNLAVIMPAVNHSFYCNEAQGERYWDYVSEELPATMHRFFRLSDRPEDTFAAGLSMGGYGTMKLALTHPERYAAVGCFSGAVDLAWLTAGNMNHHDFERVLGPLDKFPGSDNDLFHLMAKNADAPKKPRIYVSCGDADFIFAPQRGFAAALKENHWDVTYTEIEGAIHEWSLWDDQIAKFIPWMLESH